MQRKHRARALAMHPLQWRVNNRKKRWRSADAALSTAKRAGWWNFAALDDGTHLEFGVFLEAYSVLDVGAERCRGNVVVNRFARRWSGRREGRRDARFPNSWVSFHRRPLRRWFDLGARFRQERLSCENRMVRFTMLVATALTPFSLASEIRMDVKTKQ